MSKTVFPPVPADAIARAVEVLRAGGIVCIPTETYYGLAVSALDATAVERLVSVRGREPKKPIATIVADLEGARRLWREPLPSKVVELAERYWPGPLTIVAPARQGIPALLVGDTGGVGARVSSHPWAHALAVALGLPITATSANRPGASPACRAAEARAQLGDRVSLYLDAGPTPGGPPSTVVAVEDDEVRLVRAGAVELSR